MPKREDNPSPEELRREAADIEKEGESSEGKNPRNVAGGKKAAAARKEQGASREKEEDEE